MAKMKWEIKAAIVGLMMAVAFSVSGCQMLKNFWESGGEETIRLVVQEGVEAMIKANPEYQARILEITAKGREFMEDSPMATAGEIVEVIRKEIRWEKLDPNERILVDTLLTVSQQKIAEAIEKGDVKEDAKAQVGKYFVWLEQVALEGAALYGG